MVSDGKDRGNARAAPSRGPRYESTRKPKLRAAALAVPPPVPVVVEPLEGFLEAEQGPAEDDTDTAEIGLRMLAALESMPSLEPDYCDDLAAEAAVTIIERATPGEPDRPHVETPGSLRARLDDVGEAPDLVPDEYAAYQGPVEEAVVEIVHRPDPGQNAAPQRPGRRSR